MEKETGLDLGDYVPGPTRFGSDPIEDKNVDLVKPGGKIIEFDTRRLPHHDLRVRDHRGKRCNIGVIRDQHRLDRLRTAGGRHCQRGPVLSPQVTRLTLRITKSNRRVADQGRHCGKLAASPEVSLKAW